MVLRRFSFPLLIGLLLVILTTLPNVVAWMTAPAGTTFGGILSNITDINSHFAKMQLGLRGEWLFTLLFTTEVHQPAFVVTFYIALGNVARLLGLPLELAFHIGRIVFTALMVGALWKFLCLYLEETTARWALLLAIFGGGTGYLLYFLAPAMTAEISPIELWLQDGYTFLAVFTFPHFAAALALLFYGFVCAAQNQRIGLLICTSLLGLVQPYLLPLVDVLLLISIGWNVYRQRIQFKSGISMLALLGAFHVPILLYQYVILYTWDVWKDFTAQNITHSPPPIYFLFGYAPLLFPALGAMWLILRRRGALLDRWLVPVLWIILAAMLLYAPLATQRRYTFGIQAPLAALTVLWFTEAGVPWMRRHLRRRWKLALLIYGVIAVLSTVIVNYSFYLKAGEVSDPETFLTDDVTAALNWLRENTYPTDTVLSGFQDGGRIAARTGRRVVLGHWIETIHYERVRAEVRQFFAPETTDQWRYQFMAEQGVHYLWYSDEERQLGDWNPDTLRLFPAVYKNDTVTIYRMDWVY